RPPRESLVPYTTLFRSGGRGGSAAGQRRRHLARLAGGDGGLADRRGARAGPCARRGLRRRGRRTLRAALLRLLRLDRAAVLLHLDRKSTRLNSVTFRSR